MVSSGASGSAQNPTLNPALVPVMVPSPGPVVAQPTGHTRADEQTGSTTSYTQEGAGGSRVDRETAQNPPGYHTTEYAQLRANKLALRDASNLSAELLLSELKKLANYLYSFAKVLASPEPGSNFDVDKMWRYVRNGAYIITRANMLNVVVEILFFYHIYMETQQRVTV